MKLGIVVNRDRVEAVAFADDFVDAARAADCEVLVLEQDTEPTPENWSEDGLDAVIAIGGDGTVLDAARRALPTEIPVLGVNLGTLGFLAEAEPTELSEVIEALRSGDYTIEERNTIEARLGEVAASGVNDVVVEKIDSQRLVVLDVEVDGERFLSYRADGIVVSTSTGSTAYGFSAGGPLIDPSVHTLQVLPVAPHSLFGRALVLAPDTQLEISVIDDRPVRVSVDGREIGTMEEGQSVTIGPGAHAARFIRLDTEGFASRVSRKFRLEP